LPIPTSLPVAEAAPLAVPPADAVAAARELRPRLIEEQADTERRTFHSPEMHETFLSLGYYHMLRPKTFGGYEYTIPEFMAVIRELARGCMSTAWCLCLASGHNLQVASWWPEHVQAEVFDGPYFAAPMVGAPGGKMHAAEDGWLIDSTHAYASGIPYATHFTGHALQFSGDGPPQLSLFLIARDQIEILDDWGHTLGLKGSGSHSVRIDGALVPDDWVLSGQAQYSIDVLPGTPGLRMHGNPMYGAPGLGFFCNELAHLTIGGAWAALDEYEALMPVKKIGRPPFPARIDHTDFQTWYGLAVVRLAAAEAIADRASQLIMDFADEAANGGRAFDAERDMFVNQLSREALTMAWKTVEDILVRTVGSSATAEGARMERIWRDLTMAWGHLNTSLRDIIARDFALARLGRLGLTSTGA
jgi:3-hydroxy-9,10-secoandrosta-1,3,5(10)-triene-9,17-dione monooxygenase